MFFKNVSDSDVCIFLHFYKEQSEHRFGGFEKTKSSCFHHFECVY